MECSTPPEAGDSLRSPDNGVTWEKIGDEKSTTAIYGDGKRLYTHQAWGGPKAPFVTTLESDGLTWTPYEGGTQTFEMDPTRWLSNPMLGSCTRAIGRMACWRSK